jgi:5-methylcytosine-specific restriction endonuclease McrA
MKNISQKDYRKKIRDRNREYVRKIKESNPCTDCEQFYHYSQMDFDHIGFKKQNIAKLVNSEASIKTIKQEISQCQLVCSNCHRLRTWLRLHES